MLFNSFEFIVFFATVFCGYYSPPFCTFQVQWLVLVSCVFYAWTNPLLLILLALSVLFNAIASFAVANVDSVTYRFRIVVVGVGVNLAILGFFKYAGLISHSLSLGDQSWLATIPLPIGISFYTFEGISLIVDTFREKKNPDLIEKVRSSGFYDHLQSTALFVTFFPHLIAGPILKANSFFPGITRKDYRNINWSGAISALISGYFFKTVVADNIAAQTNFLSFPYYKVMSLATSLTMLMGYSVQIFSDFAGYSLIAIGLGRLLGYELLQNFNYPYLAPSLSDFWRRWHISLSTWLRDYLYIPLGGNKVSPSRVYLNLILVMALGGMWHGAAWSYALWGLYHGFGLALERLLGLGDFNGKGRWVLNMRRLLVFSFVTLGWTFFKFTDANQAFDFLRLSLVHWKEMPELKRVVPILVYCLPIALYYWHASHMIRTKGDQGSTWIGRKKQWVLGVMLFLVFVNRGQSGEFIYFQF